MLEILQNFEQTTNRFSPIVLIGPGLAIVLVGFFVWLGGLGFRKLLVAVAGAVSGGIGGFFLASRNIMVASIGAGVSTVIAIIFERLFITILTAALAAAFGFAVLAGLYIDNSEQAIQSNADKILIINSTLNTHESIKELKAFVSDIRENIKESCSRMPVYVWVILSVVAVVFIVVGFFLQRLASALCCSVLGTMLIYAGMILLLLYKGSLPISSIYSKPTFYGAIFVTMIVFGTIEQLLLCKRVKRESIKRNPANKVKEEPEETMQDWRTI